MKLYRITKYGIIPINSAMQNELVINTFGDVYIGRSDSSPRKVASGDVIFRTSEEYKVITDESWDRNIPKFYNSNKGQIKGLRAQVKRVVQMPVAIRLPVK